MCLFGGFFKGGGWEGGKVGREVGRENWEVRETLDLIRVGGLVCLFFLDAMHGQPFEVFLVLFLLVFHLNATHDWVWEQNSDIFKLFLLFSTFYFIHPLCMLRLV